MLCPGCDQPGYRLAEPCPHCGFNGDPACVEELFHVEWLLNEVAGWLTLPAADRRAIRRDYVDRQRDLEIKLGLRLPPFDDEQAAQAWPTLFKQEALLQQLKGWLEAGLLNPAGVTALVTQTSRQVDDLLEQLEGRARPTYPQSDADRLAITNFLLEAVAGLSQSDYATSPAESAIRTPLLAEQERLEINLGLRPPPEAEAAPTIVEAEPAPTLPAVAPEPPAPALPWRDRLWRTLLSERTLQAMLFLGIFLLFSAALSFVAWGWKDFSAPLRVAIPTGFTALFFALGRFVRLQTHLRRSAIALSAVAALLIPIDFYTVYANFDIPPEHQPLFWFVTSLICLGAYIITALAIQSQLFGYLVGVAAGSTLLAAIEMGHQAFGLSLDWRTAGLSALALCFTVLVEPFVPPARTGVTRIFVEPLRYLSLIAVGVLMPLSFGWRYTGRVGYDTLHTAMTINWALGGLMFAWGAVRYRSRSLVILAALALPVAVYMAQAALFDRAGIRPAWHAFGWAWLVPLYFLAGRAWLGHKDEVLHNHGRTAVGWGVVLLGLAALWSLTDLSSGAAAASSHAVLAGAVVLAALLWQRPTALYGASFLSLSAVTFAMTELDLNVSQLSLGWASLAILHIILALNVGDWPRNAQRGGLARPLVVAGYIIAGLALGPPLFPYDGPLLAYTLGNWLGLAAWGARLASQGHAGFAPASPKWGQRAVFHWLTALPLPAWVWVLFANRGPLGPDFSLALAALAWGMVGLSYRLRRPDRSGEQPWYMIGLLVNLAAPIVAFAVAPHGFAPALALLAAGGLYLADAVTRRQPLELTAGGLVLAGGLALLLDADRLAVTWEGGSCALALLVAAYFLVGLWTERERSPVFTHNFLRPLYWAGHGVALVVLWRIYSRPMDAVLTHAAWTDEMKVWGAALQLLLGVVYGLYAWGTYKEHWGHLAAWLGAAGGGFLAMAYSQGHGSSAAKGALAAIAFVLAERGLNRLRRHPRWPARPRWRAIVRLAWRLYRRPLLVTGWVASAGVVGLALVRNLWLLGGGRTQQLWAAAGLLLITGLYALAARLFRRARFLWLAALLVFAPWTILTNLGWLTVYRPTLPSFALSWAVLAWLLFLLGRWVNRLAGPGYALPLKAVAYVLLPFALVWGIADVDTSRFTFALAIGLYGLAAFLDLTPWPPPLRGKGEADSPPLLGEPRASPREAAHGPGERLSGILAQTKFLYPALGLVPVWSVYLMSWLLPAAHHEHYGLMLLAFGPLGLIAGRLLRRMAPSRPEAGGYALPGYLTGYTALIVGTLLTAHIAPLLALALLYDGLLMLVSARLFRSPAWVYPAAVLAPLSLLIALNEAGIPGDRRGWWLIGLAAVYLALAWALRRARLLAYQTAALTVGFALIALGLPPSSQDRTGALWGYGAAALLYALTAAWLRQPLLLTPACALAIVPYAVTVQRSFLSPDTYGLALFPGALAALALGWGLDARLGRWGNFPWGTPAGWPQAAADRLVHWWGLPLTCLGFGLALASPFFTQFKPELTALNWLLLMPIFAWALWRFRLRAWLLACALAGHLAAAYYLAWLGWWRYPSYAWLRFLPVTLLTAALALFVERRYAEGSPLRLERLWPGWSRPLYLLAALDVAAAQLLSLGTTSAGAAISLVHALLIATLASFWLSGWLPYASATLGFVALVQWMSAAAGPVTDFPVALARLVLVYGLVGHGLAWGRAWSRVPGWLAIWELPLQRFSLWTSLGILAATAIWATRLPVWTMRALLGYPFRQIVDMATVQMVVGVLASLGLLYMAAAYTYRRWRLSYVAVGMLLVAWTLHAFYIQQWDGAARVQWYAMPAGAYLLGIAFLEWERGNRTLARWLDYSAVVLMMGSLFWQTLLYGWQFALLLGGEGFAAFWWGSARRLRRFLYTGMVGVILATVAQLINSLQSINQWIVFGMIGLLVIVAAVLIERKLEEIKAWLVVLETWE
jgi:hypothetical protein